MYDIIHDSISCHCCAYWTHSSVVLTRTELYGRKEEKKIRDGYIMIVNLARRRGS